MLTKSRVISESEKPLSFRLTSNDLDARCMACVDHVVELSSVTTFRDELVGDGLVIRPPLGALDVFLRGAHLGGSTI